MATDSEPRLLDFGTRLRHLRSEAELSQEGLGLLAGLDRTYVSGVERGTRNIGLENILKLADALAVSPSALFEGWSK